MSPPRLSIRVDVDVEHARQALETHLLSGGAPLTADGRPTGVADMVRALRERLRNDVLAAYPDARVVVTMWRKEPKARATKVRIGHRTADGHTERRCALIGEHVDTLRAAAIAALGAAPPLTNELAPLGGEASLPAGIVALDSASATTSIDASQAFLSTGDGIQSTAPTS